MSEPKMRVAVFCEGELQTVARVATKEEGKALARGAAIGGYAYGAGSVATYVLPDDEAEMRKKWGADLADRALATEPD